jgi:hypothetical protein
VSRDHDRLAPWQRTLSALRATHTELVRLCPYRDHGLVPSPAASVEDIVETERRLGVKLPAEYRQFLRHSNGWRRLFDGADLLATSELGDARLKDAAYSLLDQASPLGPSQGRFLVPFGADPAGTTVFAFDYTVGGREPSIMAWVSELGLGATDFGQFLELLLSLAERDLSVERERSRAMAGSGAPTGLTSAA